MIDYDSHPLYAGVAPREKVREKVLEAFEVQLEQKRSGLRHNLAGFQSRATDAVNADAHRLASDGAVCLTIDRSSKHALRQAMAHAEAELKERLDGMRAAGERIRFADTNLAIGSAYKPVSGREDLFNKIASILDQSDVRALAEAYYPNRWLKICNVTLRRNVPGQEFCRGGWRRLGLPDCRTSGMHIDSNTNLCFNAIIYLGEVGSEQGPFKYVRGSNHYRFDEEDRAVRKAVDETPCGSVSGAGELMLLPEEYRRKASFGFDLADGSPEAEQLLADEVTFTSDDGDLLLFDSEGVHRGGDVATGHRSAILVNFKVKPKA